MEDSAFLRFRGFSGIYVGNMATPEVEIKGTGFSIKGKGRGRANPSSIDFNPKIFKPKFDFLPFSC